MTLSEIITESENEHATPCAVNEWREAKVSEKEAAMIEHRLAGRQMKTWTASVVVTNGKKKLRYTRKPS